MSSSMLYNTPGAWPHSCWPGPSRRSPGRAGQAESGSSWPSGTPDRGMTGIEEKGLWSRLECHLNVIGAVLHDPAEAVHLVDALLAVDAGGGHGGLGQGHAAQRQQQLLHPEHEGSSLDIGPSVECHLLCVW